MENGDDCEFEKQTVKNSNRKVENLKMMVKIRNFIDQNVQLFRIGCQLCIALPILGIIYYTHKKGVRGFTSVKDIPIELFQSRSRIKIKCIDIDNHGILQVQHYPILRRMGSIFTIFSPKPVKRNDKSLFPMRIYGITASQKGITWIRNSIINKNIIARATLIHRENIDTNLQQQEEVIIKKKKEKQKESELIMIHNNNNNNNEGTAVCILEYKPNVFNIRWQNIGNIIIKTGEGEIKDESPQEGTSTDIKHIQQTTNYMQNLYNDTLYAQRKKLGIWYNYYGDIGENKIDSLWWRFRRKFF